MAQDKESRQNTTNNDHASISNNNSEFQEEKKQGGFDEKIEIKLKKEIGLLGVVGFLVGTMIGSGIFISPKGVLRRTHSVGLCLVVWAVSGLISLLTDVCMIELAFLVKKSGSSYIWIFAMLGPIWAYMRNFLSIFLTSPSSGASQSLSTSNYVLSIFFTDGCISPVDVQKITAVAVIVSLCMINIYSVRFAIDTQVFFMFTKVSALAIICMGGIIRLAKGYTDNFQNAFEGSNNNPWELVDAFYAGLWPYAGSTAVLEVYEEIKNPKKNVILGFIISMLIVSSVYMLANISYFTAMTPDELLASNAVVTTWAEEVIPQFAWIMPVFVAMSVFGSLNGSVFNNGRSIFVPAREKHFPSLFAMIQVDFITPMPSLLFYGLMVILFIFLGENVETLISWLSFTGWLINTVLFSTVIYARFSKKWKDIERPVKAPLVVPIFMVCLAIYFVVGPLVANPTWGYLSAFVIAAIAALTYYPFVMKKMVVPGTDTITEYIQLLLQVVPTTSLSLSKETMFHETNGKLDKIPNEHQDTVLATTEL